MQLGFNPINVTLLVNNEMLEQLSARVVVYFEAGSYSGLENRQRGLFQSAIIL